MVNLKKLLASKQGLSKQGLNKKASLLQQLQAFLVDIFSSQQLANPKLELAFSGGLDSCVLLHLLAQAKKTIPFQLAAQHIHHGLSANADDWAAFCQAACNNLNVPLTISKVQIDNTGFGLVVLVVRK